MRPCGQLINIFTLALIAFGELLSQLRQHLQHVVEQLLNGGARRYAAFNDPIEQVLNRPRQLTQYQGPHHTSAAFEGVKATPQLSQCGAVFRVFDPLRQGVVQDDQYLVCLFKKDVQQLFINGFFVDGRCQQTVGNVLCRRIERR